MKFGVSGMDLVAAGTAQANSGHHHLLIDTPLPPLDREIPSDLNHLHFGRAQTEAEITLSPGEHTLQLLLGDHEHLPHDPPIFSKVVRVRVADAPSGQGCAGRSSRPAGDRRRRTRPSISSIRETAKAIYPNSTIRFGLRNMGVAPAGVSGRIPAITIS